MCVAHPKERERIKMRCFFAPLCVCVCVSGLFFHRVKMCRKMCIHLKVRHSHHHLPSFPFIRTYFYPLLFSPVGFSFHFYITFLPILPTHVTHTKKEKKKNALHSLYKGHHIQNVGGGVFEDHQKKPTHTRSYKKKRRGLSVCLSFVCTDTPPQKRPQNSFT